MGKGHRWTVIAAAAIALGAVPGPSDEGAYDPDNSWITPYFDNVLDVRQAERAGYEALDESCAPGVGIRYARSDQLDAWVAGERGGVQILLYDETDLLVGVQYAYTVPESETAAPVGMEGPVVTDPEAPSHVTQHIYFSEPQCSPPEFDFESENPGSNEGRSEEEEEDSAARDAPRHRPARGLSLTRAG